MIQEKAKKIRAMKEARKKKELGQQKEKTALTQGCAEARVAVEKELEGNLKEVMKNKHHAFKNAESSSALESKKRKSVEKRVKASTDRSNNTAKEMTVAQTAPTEERRPMKKMTKEIPQGGRRVPEASDKYGCIHQGLLEWVALPKTYLQAYVKVGGWLHKSHARTVQTRRVLAQSECWMCQLF